MTYKITVDKKYIEYKTETGYEVTRITQKHRAGSDNRRC